MTASTVQRCQLDCCGRVEESVVRSVNRGGWSDAPRCTAARLARASLPVESKQTGIKVIMSDGQKREKSKENEHFAAACMPAASRRISLLVDRERSCASGTAVEVMRARSDQLRARSKRQPRLAARRKTRIKSDQVQSSDQKRAGHTSSMQMGLYWN